MEELGAATTPRADHAQVADVAAAAAAVAAGGQGVQGGRASARTAAGDARSGRKKGMGKGNADQNMCIICLVEPATGNNPFCKPVKKDFEAAHKDSIANGNLDVLERARADTVTIRTISKDYREHCSVQKTESGWARPPYDFTRVDQIFADTQVARKGGRSHMVDYFDIVEMFEKRMTSEDADKYWRRLLNDKSLDQDEEGMNPDYPTHVEFVQDKVRQRFDEYFRENQTRRRCQEIKSGSDEVFNALAAQHRNLGNSEFGHARWTPMLGECGSKRKSAFNEEMPLPSPLPEKSGEEKFRSRRRVLPFLLR